MRAILVFSYGEATLAPVFISFAPRDLQGGSHWHEGLSSAIDECQALVLILSSNSSRSLHVLREVDIAADQRKAVLPIRIDRADMPGGLYYFLKPFQFMQASPALDEVELEQTTKS